MKAIIIEDNLLKAMKAEIKQLNVASELTAIDIYVGDDHLRIATRIDMVEQVIREIMKLIRIPGETIICHEIITADNQFIDYTKYPIVLQGWELRFILQHKLNLVRMYECEWEGQYIKTTSHGLVSAFAEHRDGCIINKYLTKL